ncbi:MAG: ABC transporter permease [Anaerolineae bacterium]
MNLLESIRTSLGAIASNKLRAFLTVLGIVIGVAAVVALSSLGEGVQAMVRGEIEGMGANVVYIQAMQPRDSNTPALLTMGDAQALMDPFNAPSLTLVSPASRGQATAKYGEETKSVSVIGTNAAMASINSLTLAAGGFLTEHDLENQAAVAVIGWNVYTDMFAEGEYPLEKTLIIDGVRFRIVGVLEATGGMLGTDDALYVPISTAQSRLFPDRSLSGEYTLSAIYASAASTAANDAAVEEIKTTLRDLHGIAEGDEDDFMVTSQQEILDMSGEILGVLTAFLGAIAAISLLVGGIGIMNIMLVTVTERTREIGIRKAIGATSEAILGQFLIEALLLTLSGGLLGVLIGVTLSEVLGPVLGVTPQVTSGMLLLAAGVCTAVGVLFGVYPAMRAARLRPIEALRYE